MTEPPRAPGDSGRGLRAAVALLAELGPALQRQDRARIVEIVGVLVDAKAPLGEQWRQIAQIAADSAEISLARKAIGFFADAVGGSAALYEKAGFLARIGDLEEAGTLLASLPEDQPDPSANAYSRGALAVTTGDVEEARRRLELALRLRPDLVQAWLPLSTLGNFAQEPELAERLFAAGRHAEAAPAPVRAIYGYALGKARADRGEHALAFEAFAGAAALMRSAVPYSRERDRASAQEAVKGYSAEAIAGIASGQSERTDRTIFVTGLPRSGTTLVEQILVSHSAVAGGAEINLLRMLAHEAGGASHAALAGHVRRQGAASLARLWHHWTRERFPAGGRVIDKSLDSSRYLGLAAAVLPDAPFVWVKRDPLDCAWSCFRTHFVGGVPWSHDLEDIAFHFRLEDELLAHWQSVLGGRLLVVPYEALVSEPETWIRRLLDHCGLAEEPQVFAPHENRRAVTTSSVMQVRRPIGRGSVGAAEPYRRFLDPFLRAYSY